MRITVPLLLLVAAKFTFHAFYVPAFEGPDEPFHLARTSSILRGELVTGDIVASVKQHPCANDLRRAAGCPPFGGHDAEFNILQSSAAAPAMPIANYESHQPPLYYAFGKAWLALLSFRHDPIWQLLWMRLFSVILVAGATIVFLRPLARERGMLWLDAVLLVLLVPGAAESLARCANDAGVFAWCSAAVWAVARKAPTYALAVLALIGPLVKLTAIAVVAFLVVWAWVDRGRLHAIAIALTSALVLPIQWLRGYEWGGTVELNAAHAAGHETLRQSIIGFVRSAYTFVKTAYWLGEWSFFKAPLWLLALTALYVILFVASVKLRAGRTLPHAIALTVAVIATAAFFVSHRRFWGQWGGVGGWYAWGWFPWLAIAVDDVVDVRASRQKMLFISAAAVVLVANAAWFASAHAVYD